MKRIALLLSIIMLCSLHSFLLKAQTVSLSDTLIAQSYEAKADSFSFFYNNNLAQEYQRKATDIYNNLNTLFKKNKRIYGKLLVSQCFMGYYSSNGKKNASNSNSIDSIVSEISKIYDPNTYEFGMMLYCLGNYSISKRSFYNADSLFERSYSILSQPNINAIVCGSLLFKTGSCKYFLNNYKAAITFFHNALVFWQNYYSTVKETPYGQACYYKLGFLYNKLGETEKAKEYLNKELKISSKYQDSNTANTYLELGTSVYYEGNYPLAMNYYNKALEIQKKILNKNDIQIANTINNIGNILKERGEYYKAIEFLNQSLAIKALFYKQNNSDIATSINNIGIVYYRLKKYSLAIQNFHLAINMFLEISNKPNPAIYSSYYNLGICYLDSGLYIKASDNLFKSLTYYLSDSMSYLNNISVVYQSIAKYFELQNNLPEAIKNLNNALRIAKKQSSKNFIRLASILNSKASIDLRLDQYRQALSIYQKSICINSAIFSDSSDYFDYPIISNYYDAGCLLQSIQGKLKAFVKLYYTCPSGNNDSAITYLNSALKHYQLCDTVINQQFNKMSNPADALSLIEKSQMIYAAAVQTAYMMYEKTNDKHYQELAYYFASANKSRMLLRDIYTQNGLKISGIPDSLIQKEFILKSLINNVKQKLLTEDDSTKKKAFQNHLYELNRDYEALVSVFEKKHPKYYEAKYSNTIPSISEIQQLIQDEQMAVLDYCLTDSLLFCFLITKNDFKVFKTTLKDSDFRSGIKECLDGIKLINPLLYIHSASSLYRYLILPVFYDIKDKTKLIIIPSAEINYVPFEALLTREVNGFDYNTGFSSLPYFVRQFEISYSYSPGLFKYQLNQPANAGKGFIAFAPVFSSHDSIGRIVNFKADTGQADHNVTQRSITKRNSFKELTYSLDEVNSIAKSFSKFKTSAVLYTYGQATEKNFKEKIAGFNYVHIASHSFMDDIYPELSGIAFSKARTDSVEAGNDGIFYSPEAYSLKISADLLVLSSCESGIGTLSKGEGMMSMARGFIYSGVNNLLYSLWKVYDKPTSKLMRSFYNHVIKGESYSTSLRNSKLEMIKNPAQANPKFWAGFVLIGK